MNFATRMKQLKLESNITTKELADKLKVARTTVSNWENGNRNPDFDTLKRIANIFETTTDYILGVSNTRNPEQTNQLKENPNPLIEKIENLSPESIEELEKYMELLKIKEQIDKSKDETSSALENEA